MTCTILMQMLNPSSVSPTSGNRQASSNTRQLRIPDDIQPQSDGVFSDVTRASNPLQRPVRINKRYKRPILILSQGERQCAFPP